MTKQFDVFLSYPSVEGAQMLRLRSALEMRGVSVWTDRLNLRPGDQFPDALREGIATSHMVAILVAAGTEHAKWVRWEYERAQEMADRGVRIVPLLLQGGLPSFLKETHFVDFRNLDQDGFDRSVDKLVWPGLTGKRPLLYPIDPYCHSMHAEWDRLKEAAKHCDVRCAEGNDLHRAAGSFPVPGGRTVVAIDPFEGGGSPRRYSPEEYLDFVSKARADTRGTNDELVFLLYTRPNSDEWRHLPSRWQNRLSHYFHLDARSATQDLLRAFREVWTKCLRELIAGERRVGGSLGPRR